MGAGGEDLLLSPAARRKFGFSVECKNVEKLNVWNAMSRQKPTVATMVAACDEEESQETTGCYGCRSLYGARKAGI